MANKFGTQSEANLKNVHPELVAVHRAVLPHYDHSITDGERLMSEQIKNVEKGVSKTLDSKHLIQPSGFAEATDSMPFPKGDWRKIEQCLDAVRKIDPTMALLRFYHFQGFFLGIATSQGVDIRQGIDWNQNTDLSDQTFFDLPHNEYRGRLGNQNA